MSKKKNKGIYKTHKNNKERFIFFKKYKLFYYYIYSKVYSLIFILPFHGVIFPL